MSTSVRIFADLRLASKWPNLCPGKWQECGWRSIHLLDITPNQVAAILRISDSAAQCCKRAVLFFRRVSRFGWSHLILEILGRFRGVLPDKQGRFRGLAILAGCYLKTWKIKIKTFPTSQIYPFVIIFQTAKFWLVGKFKDFNLILQVSK